MRLNKFLIALYALFAKACLAGIIIETSTSQESGLIEAAVNILRSCYLNRVGTVGLAGNLAGIITKELRFEKYIPVTLIDNTTRGISHGPVHRASRYKLQIFVVTATSPIVFAKTLKEIKATKLWNHMAFFLVLDQSFHGCSRAFQVLWAAWEMDLLVANFICEHETKGRLIYTYNPYTSEAPEPWQLERTYNGRDNHTWTLFVRKYREIDGICDNLEFDKTRDLGGYQIRSTVVRDVTVLSNFTRNGNGTVRLGGVYGKIAQMYFRAMNATPVVLEPTSYGFVDDAGKPHGGFADVVNGISDLSLTGRYPTSKENFTITYPLWESGPVIMSQYRAHASQLDKIASLLDVYSRLGVGLVLLVTLIFFICFRRQSLTLAFLNTVLILCNAALSKVPNNQASRIYLASLSICMLNIQGIYQGSLASLLSKQVPLRNVNSLQDIVDLNYTIYSQSSVTPFFIDSGPMRNHVVNELPECTNIVLVDSASVCVFEKKSLIMSAAKYKLHLSTEQIAKVHVSLLLRENWPLERTLNRLLARLFEADLIRLRYEREAQNILRRIEINENLENDRSIKVLTLKELSFAFVILGIGLLCAAICFIIEMGIGRVCLKIINTGEYN